MRIMTEKRYNALMNKTFMDGYKMGEEAGKLKGLMMVVTPNDIRELFGFPRIENKNDIESE